MGNDFSGGQRDEDYPKKGEKKGWRRGWEEGSEENDWGEDSDRGKERGSEEGYRENRQGSRELSLGDHLSNLVFCTACIRFRWNPGHWLICKDRWRRLRDEGKGDR